VLTHSLAQDVRPRVHRAAVMGPNRRHLFAGIGLPIRALVRMWNDPHDRGQVGLVLSLVIVGVVFYTIVEGWSVVDAIYFSTMSLATVGYGDIVPTTEVGKIFTVVYVLAGIGTLVSFFTTLTRHTFELARERQRAREQAS
jgi:voltage-gated potassium channel